MANFVPFFHSDVGLRVLEKTRNPVQPDAIAALRV